ncbi:MAG: L-threonylcarbamoyladenylate synthase [Chlamydiae bacterium]|nr:L-threonylcarbamoyladenylate synthase [Chlamydiota bacterium]
MAQTYLTEILSEESLDRAVELLQQGEIVAFPTETVFGLGAPIFSPEAIAKIFLAKGRPSDNPLIAHISDLSQVEMIAQNVPEDFHLLAKAFFPGPLTVVLEKTDRVPSIVSGGLNTVAFRMPSHPVARNLISLLGQPIVAPSANISGKPSSTSLAHVLHDFNGKIAAIIEGVSSEIGIESTVISLMENIPIILRPGHITKEEIEKVLGKEVRVADCSKKISGPVSSPGMKYRHYAPVAPLKLFFTKDDLLSHLENEPACKRLLLSPCVVEELKHCLYTTLSAKNLYAALRQADSEVVDEVLVFCDDTTQKDAALMNRILKAAE